DTQSLAATLDSRTRSRRARPVEGVGNCRRRWFVSWVMGQERRMQKAAERSVRAGAGGWVRRPTGAGAVDVAYLRPRPGSGLPIVVLPGGPGLASAVPYRALRRRAAQRGLDVLMM